MNSTVKEVIEWIICIVVAIVLAILIRYFIGTPTEVKMTSMSPTLRPGERLILNKIPITFGQELKRGDIITFERPSKLTGVESVKAEYNYKPENIFSSFVYINVFFAHKRIYQKQKATLFFRAILHINRYI